MFMRFFIFWSRKTTVMIRRKCFWELKRILEKKIFMDKKLISKPKNVLETTNQT